VFNAETKSEVTLEAKVIRKDGTIEDLGEIWSSKSEQKQQDNSTDNKKEE
jgi:hypothetical protein